MAPSSKLKLHFLRYLDEMSAALTQDDPVASHLIAALQARLQEKLPEQPPQHLPPSTKPRPKFPLPEQCQGAKTFALFSDGACRGNPGPGAWASIGQNCQGTVLFESSGVESSTTNNCMEMEGALEALKSLDHYLSSSAGEFASQEVAVFLYSDSKYLVNGMNQWIKSWKQRGWKKKDRHPPENLALWQQLDEIKNRFWTVDCHWVKAHAGHPQNEHCDQLANRALDESGF